MKKIELILIALITIIGSFSFAFGEETADDLDQGLVVPTCGHITTSETHLLNSTIGLNVTSASFILSWGNADNDLEMVLVTPSGMEIDPEVGEPIAYQRNASLIYYTIPSPEPGNWAAEITARTVQETGEDYCAFAVLDEEEVAMVDKTASENSSNFGDEVHEDEMRAIEECAQCNSH